MQGSLPDPSSPERGKESRQTTHPASSSYPALQNGVHDILLHGTVRRLWAGRRFVLLSMLASLLASVVFLAGSRAEFETSATLMPEKLEDNPIGAGSGLLRQFGGLIGLSGADALRGGNTIPVELYPDIVGSLPVQLALLEHPVYVPSHDTTVALAVYLDEMRPFSLWESLQEGVLLLPGRLKEWFSDAPPATVRNDSGIVRLDLRQLRLLSRLGDGVQAGLDKKTGVLTLSVRLPDPHVAAQAAQAAVDQLTAYVTTYRLKKLRQDLAFVELRYREARTRFNRSLDDLARFRDRNQNLTRDLARTEEQRLEAEYDLAFNVYNSLATRLEETKIKVQEETPVFQVLEPVAVPLRKSYPQTGLTLLLFLLLGALIGSAAVVLGPDVARFRRSLRTPSPPPAVSVPS